ncbi:unnamed protein product [Closterium sp. Yama58-4]|nr:unnamed protein product [Closterium sp. Yama58-4]
MSHGSTSESSSSSAHSSRQIDEEAATGGSAGRRRKRHVQDVIEGSARVEGKLDAPPAPSSDDDPNEALPRRYPVDTENEDDAKSDNEAEADAEEVDAGAERAPNDTPVMREELQSMQELHEATARAKPWDDVNNKRKRRRKRGSGNGKCRKARRSRSTSETTSEEEDELEEGDDGHVRHSTSAILQEALELLPTDKGWKLYHMEWLEHVVTDAIRHWEVRQGRFSNSAGSNAQIVDGLHVLVKAAVTRAIVEFRSEYDAASQS